MKPTVVVGYDRTPHSERALFEAGREAVLRGAAVKVVHAVHLLPATLLAKSICRLYRMEYLVAK
jgi:nucleotide-binding universal stress UspA family protein